MNPDDPYDLVGIGIGPFNLSLAALTDLVPDLRALFLERKPAFSWHPGLLLDGAMLQVSFLADLTSLVDPTSRWTFLAYLHAHDRLLPFYLKERWRPSRREYDDYCRWVASSLPSCRFGATVVDVAWSDEQDAFAVTIGPSTASAPQEQVYARNLVIGIGTEPVVPDSFADLLGDRVFHAADYLDRRESLRGARDITVVGSGQSGAEVFLDLLRAQPAHAWALRWLTRSPAFAPMEHSPLGLEHFTPDYLHYFRSLDEATRDRLLPAQWQLYKAISPETITEIYELLYERSVADGGHPVSITPNVSATASASGDGIDLRCVEQHQQAEATYHTDAVVLATGFAPRRPPFLRRLEDAIAWDASGRYQVGDDYRVRLHPSVGGSIYVQNAEQHRNGVGTPDLGLGAYRSAVILNAIAGRSVHHLPKTTAFTTFGVR